MAPFGITIAGFSAPQLTDIQAEINATLVSLFGANIDLSAKSVFGVISGIFSEREYLAWQAMQDVYNSQSPDTAFGASLDNVGALRGIPRLNAKASVIQNVKLFGTAGTLIPSGTQFSVLNSPTSIFALNSNVTLAAGQSCIQTISFSTVPTAGQWRITLGGSQTSLLAFNANAAAVQTAIQALRFASGCTVTGNYSIGFTINFNGPGTGGFMVQPQFLISFNTLVNSLSAPVTVTPLITQAGLDQANVTVTSTATGPIIANAGTLTVIVTPVAGLTQVLNVQDGAVGMDVETDNVYRARMARELQIAGAGTVEAIRSKLLQVSGVTAAIVFENTSLITDPDNIPPKAFEAIVQGGTDADIANELWAVKPAGIQTYGTSSYVITDSMGLNHTIYFSRPTVLSIYIIINISVDSSYPVNGDATVIQDLVDYGNSLGIGTDVIVVPKLVSSIAAIPGIDSAQILIGTAPSPGLSNNILVAANEIAIFDTARIIVNHV